MWRGSAALETMADTKSASDAFMPPLCRAGAALPSARSLLRTARYPVAVLLVCAVSTELIDIAAAGHVITQSGIVPMLVLWLWDGFVGLAVLSGLGAWVARTHSAKLLAPLCLGFGVLYAGGALAATLDPKYWQVLYGISSIEYQLLPIAAWMVIYHQTPSVTALGRLQAATQVSSGIAAAIGAQVAATGAMAVAATAGALLVLAALLPRSPAAPPKTLVYVADRWQRLFDLWRLRPLRILTLLAVLHGFAYTLVLSWVLAGAATGTGVAGVALWYAIWRFGRIVVSAIGSGWGSRWFALRFGGVQLLLAVPLLHALALLVVDWYREPVLSVVLGLGLAFVGALETPIVKTMLTRFPTAHIDLGTALIEGFAPAVGGIAATCCLLVVYTHSPAYLSWLTVASALGLLVCFVQVCRPAIRGALV
jgi:hypothetical protein